MRTRGTVAASVLAAAVVPWALAGCDAGSSSDGRVDIVASTDVWGDIAASVGGDDVDVHSIISDPSQDPHTYTADARTLLAVKQADLVIENGGGYDDFMESLLRTTDSSAPVIDAVTVSGHTPDSAGELNEHVWYDVASVVLVAQQIDRRLDAIDPDHRADYDRNTGRLVASLTALERAEARDRPRVGGHSIGITEPVPLYLTDALGLNNPTPAAFSEAVEEDGDVAVSVLKATLDLYSEHKVDALVYNAQTSGPVTEQVIAAARSAGIPVVPVTETLPSGEHYVQWMTANLDHIVAAVRSGS